MGRQRSLLTGEIKVRNLAPEMKRARRLMLEINPAMGEREVGKRDVSRGVEKGPSGMN